MVLRGEAGAGKTALLDYAIGAAAGLRVVRVTGVQSESELAYATVQQLCAPLLDQLDTLPGPQHDALATAFGIAAGKPPDRFMIGLGVLGLLSASAAAGHRPLLCAIDDMQWLDRASMEALAFAARRLQADAVALLFATRADSDDLAGLPELRVQGLGDTDARELLSSVIGTRSVDRRVFDQVIAEARGNPLMLLELPGGFTPAELTGGFAIPEVPGPAGRLEQGFLRRFQALPVPAQQLLLVAAADPTGDPVLVWNAAKQLGIRPEAALTEETGEFATFGSRVVFSSNLVRSAVYGAATPPDRRAVHHALAEATDASGHPARRAWHRALAVAGTDEEVASELEREANRAQDSGGMAAAAAFLERATALTLDPARRARRALAAAQAKQQAGAFDSALAMLKAAEAGSLTDIQRAQADLLRGRVAFALYHGIDSVPLMLKAASQFERTAPALAREVYLEALSAMLLAGRLAAGEGLLEVARAARLALTPPLTRPQDLLLDGMTLLITEGHSAAAASLGQAVAAFHDLELSVEDGSRWLWLAGHAAGLIWDYESWDTFSARLLRLAHDTGTLTALPVALHTSAGARLFAGDLAAAASLAEEATAATQATHSQIAPYATLGLAAFEGRADDARTLIESGTADALRRGEGTGLTFIQWAAAVLNNGLGRYEEAMDWARQATEDSGAQRFTVWALAELIEAAVRAGQPDQGTGALRRLSEATRACATEWAMGVQARSRALLSEESHAERLYREAVDRLGRTPLRPDLARAHLLYGEWLRRERRRIDAREQLRRAHGLFTDCGMIAFAERARVELQATGERVPKRVPERQAGLTPQETQIARLAASGATNAEIAARLFLSASTVDYHLRKVFRKLGVTSRRQLGPRLPRPAERAP